MSDENLGISNVVDETINSYKRNPLIYHIIFLLFGIPLCV